MLEKTAEKQPKKQTNFIACYCILLQLVIAFCCNLQWKCNGYHCNLLQLAIAICCNLERKCNVVHCNLLQRTLMMVFYFRMAFQWLPLQLASPCNASGFTNRLIHVHTYIYTVYHCKGFAFLCVWHRSIYYLHIIIVVGVAAPFSIQDVFSPVYQCDSCNVLDGLTMHMFPPIQNTIIHPPLY